MKKYVILGYIYGIGGFQTYMANKLKLMSENGWRIYAFSNAVEIMPGKMLSMLEPFRENRIYAFGFPYPNELSKRELKKTVEEIARRIDYHYGDEIIFEAAILDQFMWADLLAKEFGGRSICVETSNRFKKYCNTTLDFFHFKAQRGELLMMSKTGMHELFEGYIEYPEIDNNTVGALTQNEYADDGKDYATLLDTASFDYVIGTVGWLDKGYYAILIDEVIKFCQQNPNKKIQFIVVGKSLKGNIEKEYEQKAKNVENLKLSMMGSIAPVPSNLIQLFDVSVSSYGCAMITDKIGVPTIAMHDPEYIPLGLLSYTITEPPYKTRVNFDKTISEMLTDVLINHICDNYTYSRYKSTDVDEQKRVHLNRIAELPEKIEYYDIANMPNDDVSRNHKIKVVFQRIFGLKITEVVFSWLKP